MAISGLHITMVSSLILDWFIGCGAGILLDLANIRKTSCGVSRINRCFWLCVDIRFCYSGTAGILYAGCHRLGYLERAVSLGNQNLVVGIVLGSFTRSLGNSFSGILVIFRCSRNHHAGNSRAYRKTSLVDRMVRIQWAITLGLIPILLVLFQQVSLVSPIANAFIPIISLIVVPLTLLTIILPFDFLLLLAHGALTVVMSFLSFLGDFPQAVWLQHSPPFWTIATAFIGVVWMLLPGSFGLGWLRGFPARWLGLIAMCPMFLVQLPKPKAGELWLTVLDVGQGLAVVARTEQHTLLFDTGPKLGGTDSGRRIIILVQRRIRKLDVLMVSHADSDHSGGALSVLSGMPVKKVLSSLNDDHPIRQYVPDNALCILLNLGNGMECISKYYTLKQDISNLTVKPIERAVC